MSLTSKDSEHEELDDDDVENGVQMSNPYKLAIATGLAPIEKLDMYAYLDDVYSTTIDISQEGVHQCQNKLPYAAPTQWMEGAAVGNVQLLRTLISSRVDIDSRNEGLGLTSLMVAASEGQQETVNFLIESKASLDATSTEGWSALMFACGAGHLHVVKTLTAAGVARMDAEKLQSYLNREGCSGDTALILATCFGHFSIVRHLVQEAKADAFYKSKEYNFTAFRYVRRDHPQDIIEMLKKKIKDGNDGEKKGKSEKGKEIGSHVQNVYQFCKKGQLSELRSFVATHYKSSSTSASHSPASTSSASLIMLRTPDKHGVPPLHHAIINGHKDVVVALLDDYKVDVNQTGKASRSALMVAAANGNAEIVGVLIERKANANLRTSGHKMTALMLAVERPRASSEIARLLVENGGADVNARNCIGDTALIISIAMMSYESSLYLIRSAKAKVAYRGRDHSCAQDIASNRDSTASAELKDVVMALRTRHDQLGQHHNLPASASIMRMLEEGGKGRVLKAFRDAARTARLQELKTALDGIKGKPEQCCVINYQPFDDKSRSDIRGTTSARRGNTVLMLAAMYGHSQTAAFLISRKADVHLFNSYGQTALTLASMAGHVGIVSLLLREKAYVDVADLEEATPLTHAVQRGHAAVAQALIKTGRANVNISRGLQSPPLVHAVYWNHESLVKILLESKADVNIEGSFGWRSHTPIQWARICGRGKGNNTASGIIKLLRRQTVDHIRPPAA